MIEPVINHYTGLMAMSGCSICKGQNKLILDVMQVEKANELWSWCEPELGAGVNYCPCSWPHSVKTVKQKQPKYDDVTVESVRSVGLGEDYTRGGLDGLYIHAGHEVVKVLSVDDINDDESMATCIRTNGTVSIVDGVEQYGTDTFRCRWAQLKKAPKQSEFKPTIVEYVTTNSATLPERASRILNSMVTKPEMLGHGTIGDVVSMTFLYGEPKYKLGIADKVMNVGGVDLSQLRIIGELFRSNGCTVLSELVVTIDNRVGLIVRVNVGYGR